MVNSEQSRTDIKIVEFPQLTYDEERDRSILEREVERAFYKAGCALKELRDRKLYKSTHSSFEQYCEDRFGMRRRHPYRLIDAATVVDNILQLCPNRTQNESDTKKNKPIIPTSEWQIRSLTRLEPQQQREVWIKAVKLAGNKAPSGKVVSELASEIKPKQKNSVSVKLKIGHRIIVSRTHPLFPNRSGIISQIANKKDAVVELDNGKTELISQDYLELRCDPSEVDPQSVSGVSDWERALREELNSSIKKLPPEGIAYTQGVGIEYNVRLSSETWEKLNEYAARVGTATLDGAISEATSLREIARLLEQNHQV